MPRPDKAHAEALALGAAIRDRSALIRVYANLRPEQFTDGPARQVYDAIYELVFVHGKPCTAEAVADRVTHEPDNRTDMANALQLLANATGDPLDVDQAIAVVAGTTDLSHGIGAGATLAAIRTRLELSETWITRDELDTLIAARLTQDECDTRDREAHAAERARSPWMQISSTDIDGLAKTAYAEGTNPIEWAEFLAATRIKLNEEVAAARTQDPAAYPSYVVELTAEAAGRAIVGSLLDAGWMPPTLPADATAGGTR